MEQEAAITLQNSLKLPLDNTLEIGYTYFQVAIATVNEKGKKMTHTTKWGNTYSDEEWTELQNHYKDEAKKDKAISAKLNGLTKYLKRQLRENGFNDQQIKTVVSLFRNDSYVEANIQWTSAERKNFVDNLWLRWNVAMENLYKESN